MRFRSVTEYLSRDHDQMDEIRRDVERMVEDGELERADQTFEELRRRLERHIRLEEDVLFPLFENASNIRLGPTTVMRREHLEIHRLLDRLSYALDLGDVKAFRRAHEALADMLSNHDAKEEHVLYPAIDRLLEAGERDKLLEQLELTI